MSEDGKSWPVAHRVSWELHNGPVAEGLWVLHRCDQPLCVRPDHLFVGTAQDNSDDMVRKGRRRQKLTPDLARQIRERCKLESSDIQIAFEFGVSAPMIWKIRTNRSWRVV